jgi:hypothetical protein
VQNSGKLVTDSFNILQQGRKKRNHNSRLPNPQDFGLLDHKRKESFDCYYIHSLLYYTYHLTLNSFWKILN